MTNFEISSLIISAFIAIGTCGATSLALFFWLHDKAIKLGFRAMHANAYGSLPNVAGGFFVVSITNKNPWPISLDIVGLRYYQRKYICKKALETISLFPNTDLDSLPKRLEYGQTYNYSTPMNGAKRQLQAIEDAEKTKICDIKIIVCVSTANGDILLNPEKHVKSILLDREISN